MIILKIKNFLVDMDDFKSNEKNCTSSHASLVKDGKM